MNSFRILCPKCQAEIPLTEAVTHEVQERLEADFKSRHTELQKALAEREKKIAEEKDRIERDRVEIDEEIARKLAAERSRISAAAIAEAKLALNVEIQELRDRLAERQIQLQEAQKTELELRKRESALQSRAEALELEVACKLNEERARIREEARQAASDEQSLKLAEKDKLIGEMQKQIAMLKQKADQGSQQLQGEVLELDLESKLRIAFPHDDVQPVSKGTRGADVVQHVRTASGQTCSTIVWEAKRTKSWSSGWTAKLKEDQRSLKAELAVIVSVALPEGTRNFGLVDGVWICDCTCMLALATALRQGLIGAASVRLAATGMANKMEQLYEFLCSTEFRQHIEGIVESFVSLQSDVVKERRAIEKIWAAREKQIARAIRHTALLYGGIQGIAGASVLPELKQLCLDQATGDSNEAEISVDSKMDIAVHA